jgi:hypothetical protein
MKILDLVRYDPEKGCFVLKDNKPTPRALNPWEELAQVDRPSIFLEDARFRARNPTNQMRSEEDLGYKQFGTFTRAKERQPNKHEGVLEHAKAKATRATGAKIHKDV